MYDVKSLQSSSRPIVHSASPLPSGGNFIVWVLRLHAVGATGAACAAKALTTGFEHIGWPAGEIVFTELMTELCQAWGRAIKVHPLGCRCLSRDEVLLVRAGALMELGLAMLVRDEWSTFTHGPQTESVFSALSEVITELRLVGLGFAMTHIPTIPQPRSFGDLS